MSNLNSIIIFIAYALCSGCGLIILKMVMSDTELSLANITSLILNIKFIIGFILYVFGFLLWMSILSKFKLNVAFPVAMSLFFIVSSLGSY
jgi:uncharacterized protein YebE (UPF0316 family)